MSFRIAVVQPITHPPGHDERNVPEAVSHVERSAAEGAHFVCFPETYPGPWRMPALFDPTPALAEDVGVRVGPVGAGVTVGEGHDRDRDRERTTVIKEREQAERTTVIKKDHDDGVREKTVIKDRN